MGFLLILQRLQASRTADLAIYGSRVMANEILQPREASNSDALYYIPRSQLMTKLPCIEAH